MPATFFFTKYIYFCFELGVRFYTSWLCYYLTTLDCCFIYPLNRSPTLSPASPSSSVFLNISTPVTVVFFGASSDQLSLLLPYFYFSRSILPVETVPLPVIENTSSTAISKGLSMSL